MHRLHDRRYVGAPGETATVTTEVAGGGQVSLDLDGQAFPGGEFTLPGGVGSTRLRIVLVGPEGASCVVGIAVVDGGQDGDLLLCLPHDPVPVQFYDFAVAPASAIDRLGTIREVAAAVRRRPAAKPPGARKTAKPTKTRKPGRARKPRKTARTRHARRGRP
jgi:hypothetical protein